MRFPRLLVLAVGITSALATRSMAQVQPGDLAPDFTFSDSSGTPYTLSEYRGRVVLLAFIGSG